jgi:hypothetical protein
MLRAPWGFNVGDCHGHRLQPPSRYRDGGHTTTGVAYQLFHVWSLCLGRKRRAYHPDEEDDPGLAAGGAGCAAIPDVSVGLTTNQMLPTPCPFVSPALASFA